MSREEKTQIIDQLEEVFHKCSIGILTGYRGLTAAELSSLRRKLKAAGIDYKVVKNTLARLAAERLGRNEVAGLFKGPVAMVFGYGDIVEAPKALDEYIRSTRSSLSIKGGFLGARPLTANDVATLSMLPGKDILIAQVMAGLQGPIVALIGLLAAPIRGVEGVLQARIKQLEGN